MGVKLKRTFRDDRGRFRADIMVAGERVGYVRRVEGGNDYYAIIDGLEVAAAPTLDVIIRELRQTLRAA